MTHLQLKKILFVFIGIVCVFPAMARKSFRMQSPDKQLKLVVESVEGNLKQRLVCWRRNASVATLNLGVVLTDDSLLLDSSLRIAASHRCKRYHEYLLSGERADWRVRFRLYNDAWAFRYESTRSTGASVQKELSAWTFSPETAIWYFERRNEWKLKSYAGLWECCKLKELHQIASSPVQGTPIVFQLPEGAYGFISEAALKDYSGLRLKVDSSSTFTADFTEGENGFSVPAHFKSPWRVLYVGDDLNALVNQRVIRDLAPRPDEVLFADTDYIQEGKCAWRWFSKGTGTPAQEKEVIDAASQLHFLYSLVDDGWKKWPDCWKEAKELAAYAQTKQVRLFFWQHSAPLLNPEDDYAGMRHFLDSIAAIGAAGIKVDFMDSEAKPLIDFETRLLEECAKRSLLVNFHGCQKPAGEAFTYPNEMTREGIRGLELNKMREGYIPAYHNAALPFTRFVVGHGDYTPLSFTVPGTTTFAHQLATLVCFHSPLQTIAEDPALLLHEPLVAPAKSLIREVPVTWDEVRVHPLSEIGKLAILAKRKGRDWYIGILNGESCQKTVDLDLTDLRLHPVKGVAYVDDWQAEKVVLSMDGHRPAALERIPAVPFKVISIDSPECSLTLAPEGGAVLVLHGK